MKTLLSLTLIFAFIWLTGASPLPGYSVAEAHSDSANYPSYSDYPYSPEYYDYYLHPAFK